MTITNGYTTLTVVRNAIGIPAEDTSNDTYIEATIEAVSREIDNITGRRFYVTEETRYFSAVSYDECWTDDFTSVTSLKTDDDEDGTFETTWATSDYVKYPLNASVDAKPWTRIKTSGYGNYSFSTQERAVQLIGKFGYCTTTNTPKPIKEATKIQAVRVYKRKDSPFGMMGGGDMAQAVNLPDLDPDVKRLISPYIRRV